MTTIREIVVQSVGEPYSVKIERGMKGVYGYEIGIKSDNILGLVSDLFMLKKKVEVICDGKTEMSNEHDTG